MAEISFAYPIADALLPIRTLGRNSGDMALHRELSKIPVPLLGDFRKYPDASYCRTVLESQPRIVTPLANLLTPDAEEWTSFSDLLSKLGDETVLARGKISALRETEDPIQRAHIKLFILAELLAISREVELELAVVEINPSERIDEHTLELFRKGDYRSQQLQDVLVHLEQPIGVNRGER